MNQYIYVYIPRDSRRNFQTAIDMSTWGWKRRQGGTSEGAFTHLETPRETTYLVFGEHPDVDPPKPSGWPRIRRRDSVWERSRWEKLTLARVTSPLFKDEQEIWPDDTYSYRVRFELVTTFLNVESEQMHRTALEALVYSVTQSSQPALGPEPFLDPSYSVDMTELDGETDPDVPDRILGELDSLDGFARRRVRKEQKKLRQARFGSRSHITCALCGRMLPVSIVRLAHIKPRSHAAREELLNLKNTMPACTLGCDELFERAIITVGPGGAILVSQKHLEGDLGVFLANYAGRALTGYSTDQDVFFEWHRSRGNLNDRT
jgi:hypothetical protein